MDRPRRLSEAYEVNRTRSRGTSAACGPLVARILANDLPSPHNRYTVVAGKRIGKAHERNRCKRVVREALRTLDPRIKQGLDVVIIIRGGTSELSSLAVAEDSLSEIYRRTRMFTDG